MVVSGFNNSQCEIRNSTDPSGFCIYVAQKWPLPIRWSSFIQLHCNYPANVGVRISFQFCSDPPFILKQSFSSLIHLTFMWFWPQGFHQRWVSQNLFLRPFFFAIIFERFGTVIYPPIDPRTRNSYANCKLNCTP